MSKRIAVCIWVLIFIGISMACFAQDKSYRIEVLQVTDIEAFDNTLNGFLGVLEANGITQGKNLSINKRIIDFDAEQGGLWKKVGVLLRIKKEASLIVEAHPDLVLTIGTPATKYAKDKIIAAGIPLVFTAVAIPKAAGCASLTQAGPGFTGSTLYMDMKNALQIARLAFPNIKTIGIVHTDDDNALAQVQQAKETGPSAGMTFITREINKKERIIPPVNELIDQGAQAFAVPLDTYYGMRNYEPCIDLSNETLAHQIPIFSLILNKVPGAVLYIGADFPFIGSLAGQHAVKILKDGADPGDLPVLMQEDLMILVDIDRMKELKIELPLEILQLAKPVQ